MLCKYLSEFYLFLLIALFAFSLCHFPLVASLASRTAALRSVAESGPLVPYALLSRLRERTYRAERPASGPTLAGAGANSDATMIKAEVVPERRSGLSGFARGAKVCG